MPPGKMAAQAGHAFLGAFLCSVGIRPEEADAYARDPPGTKVVLQAPDVGVLEWAERELLDLGIPVYRVIDSGHVLPPHFDGGPIWTAIGFGPALSHEVDRVTRKLNLHP